MAKGKEIPEAQRKELRSKFKKMMATLYKEKGAGLRVEVLKEEAVLDFIGTHADILDSTFSQTKMSDTLRQSLQRSNWIFSGMKTFHELHEAFPSLLDEEGKRKPFERFLKDVQRVDETYNKHYLRAEYNFATASAQAAAQWEQIEADADRYHLQYRTAGDDRVRDEHQKLEGITLPPSNSFWDTYYPPNGWNCRCRAVQVRKSKYPSTPSHEVIQRVTAHEAQQKGNKRDMFRFNSGKQKKVWPDYNPYTIRNCSSCPLAQGKGKMALAFVPSNEVCAGCKLIQTFEQETRDRKKQNKAEYERLKHTPEYKDVEFDEKSGGLKATHREHNLDKKKGWYEKEVQNVGFLYGHSVILEKESHAIFGQKSVEGLWDGLPFEIAGAESATEKNIRNKLKHCAEKPDTRVAVIYFPNNNFDIETFNKGFKLFNGLKGTSQYRLFDIIYCIQGDKIIHIKSQAL